MLMPKPHARLREKLWVLLSCYVLLLSLYVIPSEGFLVTNPPQFAGEYPHVVAPFSKSWFYEINSTMVSGDHTLPCNAPGFDSSSVWLLNSTELCPSPQDAARNAVMRGALAVVFIAPNYSLPQDPDADNSSIPVLVVNSTEGVTLMSAVLAGDVYVSIPDMDIPDCSWVSPLLLLYQIITPLWVVLFLVWMYNTFLRYANHSSRLHKSMGIVPGMKMVDTCITAMVWAMCPWDDDASRLVILLRVSSQTLYNTLFFALLLLLSKGWMITHQDFSRREWMSFSFTIAVVYLTVSFYFVAPTELAPLLVCLYAVLGFVTRTNIVMNLKSLKNQEQLIARHSINALRESVQQKLRMYRWLYALVIPFFIANIAIQIARTRLVDDILIPYFADEIIDLLFMVSVGLVFRSRQFSPFFSVTPSISFDEATVVPFYRPLDPSDQANPGYQPPPLPPDTVPVVVRNPSHLSEPDVPLDCFMVGTHVRPWVEYSLDPSRSPPAQSAPSRSIPQALTQSEAPHQPLLPRNNAL
eukprot:GILJ01008924.1.p1 GENE.GILJ01008924.1~~GILJ01008924.1.p1  ORF type:complete len:525 (-),score=57.80 GILJ01008924.1:143-1717(-)